jgi:hypothetical protein
VLSGGDSVLGGEGSGALDGEAGIDMASYFESTAGMQVDLSAGTGGGGTAARDTLTGVENLTGTQFADTLTRDAAANVLMGMGGVRWRLVDLVQWVFEELRISLSPQTISREPRAMGYRRLSARPRHHA